jgi:hypothetical protein
LPFNMIFENPSEYLKPAENFLETWPIAETATNSAKARVKRVLFFSCNMGSIFFDKYTPILVPLLEENIYNFFLKFIFSSQKNYKTLNIR